MLEAIGHFGFEFSCGVIGLVLLSAGLAALIAKPSFIVEKIPLIGGFISGARIGIGAVLIAAGSCSIGIAAGYYHRGTLDQSAALEDRLKAEILLKQIAEKRANAFDEARKKAEKSADDLADQLAALNKKAMEDDERSRTYDADSCLASDSVQRLNTIGRRKGRK